MSQRNYEGAGSNSSTTGMVGVVTLYRPDRRVIGNIATYSDYLDELYVVDNTPGQGGEFCRGLQQSCSKVVCLSSGKNLGISGALNLALSKACDDNRRRLLTMDQDSHFTPEQAERFFASIDEADDGSIAVIAPHHRRLESDAGPCRYVERDIVYTSGNVLDVGIAAGIGKFDEDLFIDSVDHEFCLRAKTRGYKILQATNCYLNHEVGEGKMSGFFFRKKKMRWFHSPKRFYFMVRNALYIEKLYGKSFRVFFRKHNKELRKELIRSLKYSDERWDYLHYGLRAWRDYRKGLFGNRVGL